MVCTLNRLVRVLLLETSHRPTSILFSRAPHLEKVTCLYRKKVALIVSPVSSTSSDLICPFLHTLCHIPHLLYHIPKLSPRIMSSKSRTMSKLCALGSLFCCLVQAWPPSGDTVCMISRRNGTTEDLSSCFDTLAENKWEFDVYEMCNGHSFWCVSGSSSSTKPSSFSPLLPPLTQRLPRRNVGYWWSDPDHCFNGCEPCLRRAMELGADAAVCNKRVREAFCSAGYAPRPLDQLYSVECVDDERDWWDAPPHRACRQFPADMRGDLLRPERAPGRMATMAAPTLEPEDELEELRDFREGRGEAEKRGKGTFCSWTFFKGGCNEGHDRYGSGTDVLWGWGGPMAGYNPPVSYDQGEFGIEDERW